MARWNRDTGKTPTGGQKAHSQKKKQFQRGKEPAETKVAAPKRVVMRTLGRGQKFRQLSQNIANVYDPKTKLYKKAKIITVVSNPANPNYIRRNIMNRGAVVRTDIGEVRITSRPGQEGAINAVLLEAKK